MLEIETAKWLHSELWGKNFNSILEQVYDGLEKYISEAMVIHLCLDKLGFHEKALLIREEYVTALNMLEGPFQHFNGIIITGNPGIGESSFTIRIIFYLKVINLGKSCFLYYVLLFRLCSRKPTAFQLPSSFIVFQESGITIHNIASWNPPDVIPLGSWALTDSNGTITMPCNAFLSACGNQTQLIQASSPKLLCHSMHISSLLVSSTLLVL